MFEFCERREIIVQIPDLVVHDGYTVSPRELE